MGLSPKESQQIGRIEAKVDLLIERDVAQEERLTKLEGFASRTKGALAILSLLFTAGCAWLISGCAHYHHNEYVDGQLVSSTVSTVIGTGETTLWRTEIDELYTTVDTGVSDNVSEIVEDAVSVTPPGAAAGVFGDLLRSLRDHE